MSVAPSLIDAPHVIATNRPFAAIDEYALLRPSTATSVEWPDGATTAPITTAALVAMTLIVVPRNIGVLVKT